MLCGRCVYCGFEVKGSNYNEVKSRLKEHLLGAHRDMLVNRVEELRKRGSGIPGGSLRGFAGYIASLMIKDCRNG